MKACGPREINMYASIFELMTCRQSFCPTRREKLFSVRRDIGRMNAPLPDGVSEHSEVSTGAGCRHMRTSVPNRR